jgi:hypothetical protein
MNLEGQRFGRWLVIGPTQRRGKKGYKIYWLCRCDCGTEKFVSHGSLRFGDSRSCGCLRREMIANRQRIHGMYGTPTYIIWKNMKQRCRDSQAINYERYGARGISVCERWQNSFQNFYDDMGEVPSSGYSIERIDNEKDYTPENCRWATPKEQARNTRRNRLLTHNGKTLCLAEWAEITGIGSTTIRRRLDYYGWSVEEALTTPVLRRKGKSNVKS